jgi:hypothetical protein
MPAGLLHATATTSDYNRVGRTRMNEDSDETYDRPFNNPLDDLISFPETIVVQRQTILPSESSGWGLHMLLNLPRSIVRANLEAQLTAAGFAAESGADPQSGLLRYIRSDAYVWGMVSAGPERSTSVLLSYTPGGETTSGPPKP